MSCRPAGALGTAAILVAIGLPPMARAASAQAFVPRAGEGTVSFLFQNFHVTDHYLTTTQRDFFGPVDTNVLVVDASYGLTDRLAVDVALPFVVSKYSGDYPHPLPIAPVTLDDGRYHGTFQDVRLAVRYSVVRGRTAVTPFVGSFVPSHGYEPLAHSAPGRGLKELQVGVSVAALLDRLVPGAFVQGRYSYGFIEPVNDLSDIRLNANRSNADLEVGYFVTPGLRVFLLGSGQLTHGGIDLDVVGPDDFWPYIFGVVSTPEGAHIFRNHDRIDRFNYLNVGAGASVALSDNVDLFGSYMWTEAARNGHALSRALSLGLTVGFGRARGPDQTVTARRQGSLVRCLCQKGNS
jgi:hypothetical protein